MLITEPVGGPQGGLSYVLQGVAALGIEAGEGEDVFVLDIENQGEILWAANTQAELIKRAVQQSEIVQSFLRASSNTFPVFEYEMRVGSNNRSMIGQISRLADTGWAVLIQKPKEAAFRAVRDLINGVVLSALIMVVLASVGGLLASRWISLPIRRLAETSEQIAAGSFGGRVSPSGVGREIFDLADNFNQMSAHVERYVQRLQRAAKVNRDLFLGTIRSLLAAIEAKEPYTRGHSERVATYSQAIARHLDPNARDLHEQIWIAGLLHDVGKIGIDDRVLNKGDVLTDEEFEEMKRHPVIGAEIMASIDQLQPLLPAIRWHHERWNGEGYPDGLVGENIPMMARIVAVADTFDAVTTQRVYQDPYTPEQAVEIIRKLEGTGFDPRVVAAFLQAYDSGEVQLLPMQHHQKEQPGGRSGAGTHLEAFKGASHVS